MPYLGFTCRIDNLTSAAALRFGEEAPPNVLSVRVDGSWGSGHWYEGGGIWRSVQLVRLSRLHLTEDGVYVSPESSGRGDVHVQAEVECHHDSVDGALCSGSTVASVRFTLFDTDESAEGARAAGIGQVQTDGPMGTGMTALAQCTGAVDLNAQAMAGGALGTAACDLHPSDGLRLWSIRRPALYRVLVEVLDARTSEVMDALNVTSGFRTTSWGVDDGFRLNGEITKLRGFSHHHTFAGLGAAMDGIERLHLFRAQASRALGANFARLSHNPYSPALYAIFDALGTLCYDENRVYNDRHLAAMAALVKRDRSHPSVAVWGTCNEKECLTGPFEAGALHPAANTTAFAFRAAVHRLDATRPLAANVGGRWAKQASRGALDVLGFSHAKQDEVEVLHQQVKNGHPTLGALPISALAYTEGGACLSQRVPLPPNATLAYDYNPDRTIPWCIPDHNAAGLLPYVAGSLGVWTLFDYMGEPVGQGRYYTSTDGRWGWPGISSSFGQFDRACLLSIESWDSRMRRRPTCACLCACVTAASAELNDFARAFAPCLRSREHSGRLPQAACILVRREVAARACHRDAHRAQRTKRPRATFCPHPRSPRPLATRGQRRCRHVHHQCNSNHAGSSLAGRFCRPWRAGASAQRHTRRWRRHCECSMASAVRTRGLPSAGPVGGGGW